ncbi:LysM peptidoglycan-binding domain-containing protein [Oceanicola sp. 502str15]|uniref:LysM peptidoglycan-binding domain-containing protein n=1 Tax=Oceanicola sp. 502str15 TaxID=2696061 RepID=UPI002112F600|nr:LysM peptidoglycan-binding domain-containing protein [Oceanicola sp. 502str15]MCO6382573.1 LysM peptidoglycan-binding domain-containing protein [Oceanicola sp. 502str15]
MSAWNSLSPVFRGGLTAAALALAGLGLWLWQGGGLAPETPQPVEEAAGETGPAEVTGSGEGIDAADAAAQGDNAGGPEDTATAETPAETASPEAVESAAAETSTDKPADNPTVDAPAESTATTLPGFDLVRIEPDGASVIAGTAAPGDNISLLLDGTAIAEAEADGQGAFVILTTIQPGPAPQILTLTANGERRSEASVIVAAAPQVSEAVASADATGTSAEDRPAGTEAEAEVETAEASQTPEPEAQDTPPAAQQSQATGASSLDTGLAAATDAAPDTAPSTPASDAAEATELATPTQEDTAPVNTGTTETIAQDTPQTQPASTGAVTASAEVAATDTTTPEPAADLPSEPTDLPVETPASPPIDTAAVPAETPQAAPAEPVAQSQTAQTAPTVTSTAPQLLVASGEGLKVIQPSSSAATVPLRVETIGYSDSGVTLAGRGTGGPSDLRIYLDNAPIAMAPLEQDGTWEAELNGVSPGTYTLRVDQLAGDGSVTGRFETPFLRESEAALARSAPAATDPEGLAVSVITVQPGYSLWAIASDRYGDGMSWHKVLEANSGQIRDPDLIYPGQIFDLPD